MNDIESECDFDSECMLHICDICDEFYDALDFIVIDSEIICYNCYTASEIDLK